MDIFIAFIALLLILFGITLYLSKKFAFNPIVAFFTVYIPLIHYFLPFAAVIIYKYNNSSMPFSADTTALVNIFVGTAVSPYFYLASTSIGFLVWFIIWVIKKQSINQSTDPSENIEEYDGEVFSWRLCFRLLVIYIVWSKYLSTIGMISLNQLFQKNIIDGSTFQIMILISFISWLIVGSIQRVHRLKYLLYVASFVWLLYTVQFFVYKFIYLNIDFIWSSSILSNILLSLLTFLVYALLASGISHLLFKQKKLSIS